MTQSHPVALTQTFLPLRALAQLPNCTSQVHPTVNPGSGDILELIRDKKVLARPGIARIDGLTVHFTDGSSEDVDAIICATGERFCPH